MGNPFCCGAVTPACRAALDGGRTPPVDAAYAALSFCQNKIIIPNLRQSVLHIPF
jgi:hypothetical protein